jgi:hypothetical protein
MRLLSLFRLPIHVETGFVAAPFESDVDDAGIARVAHILVPERRSIEDAIGFGSNFDEAEFLNDAFAAANSAARCSAVASGRSSSFGKERSSSRWEWPTNLASTVTHPHRAIA